MCAPPTTARPCLPACVTWGVPKGRRGDALEGEFTLARLAASHGGRVSPRIHLLGVPLLREHESSLGRGCAAGARVTSGCASWKERVALRASKRRSCGDVVSTGSRER